MSLNEGSVSSPNCNSATAQKAKNHVAFILVNGQSSLIRTAATGMKSYTKECKLCHSGIIQYFSPLVNNEQNKTKSSIRHLNSSLKKSQAFSCPRPDIFGYVQFPYFLQLDNFNTHTYCGHISPHDTQIDHSHCRMGGFQITISLPQSMGRPCQHISYSCLPHFSKIKT